MTIALAREVLTVESEGLLAVRDRLGEEFVRAVDIIMACPSRLVVTGIGKSGLVGQKIVATLNSTGTPSFFLHPVEAMHGDLGMVTGQDLVLAISNSGKTDEKQHLRQLLKPDHCYVMDRWFLCRPCRALCCTVSPKKPKARALGFDISPPAGLDGPGLSLSTASAPSTWSDEPRRTDPRELSVAPSPHP